ARVNSASSLISSLLGATARNASGPWVSSSPATTKVIGAVTSNRSSRADSAPHPNTSAATMARSATLTISPSALCPRRSQVLRRCPGQHGDPGGHHGERQDSDGDLRRAVGEALVEQPDAQDDAGERVGDDQEWLRHAQGPDVKSGLLEHG